jgi:diketogulonate reductase-like aldo/keto reductase
MAEHAARRKQEIAALREGVELGMTLIDTAEMYADGAAETLVGEAIAGRRGDVFLVTKVLPEHATRRETVRACEQSLRRLRTSHIDLYLLHWPAATPIAETVAAFDQLQQAGKIRYWGVSNLDQSEMEALTRLATGGACATDQVLYNLRRRGIEWDLLPWCAARQMPIMAYSPIEQGELVHHPAVTRLAARLAVTASQITLAWVLRKAGIIAIPKTASTDHLRDNLAALDLRLTAEDLAALDDAFPPPTGPRALETS